MIWRVVNDSAKPSITWSQTQLCLLYELEEQFTSVKTGLEHTAQAGLNPPKNLKLSRKKTLTFHYYYAVAFSD